MSLLQPLLRATMMLMLLAAPVFALPIGQSTPSHIIEAPAPQSKGLGFVLTVILQRR